jgi:hypothetical protein
MSQTKINAFFKPMKRTIATSEEESAILTETDPKRAKVDDKAQGEDHTISAAVASRIELNKQRAIAIRLAKENKVSSFSFTANPI